MSGPMIVALDDAVTVGEWDVTIEGATPLLGALAMFSNGLGVFGLLG